MRPTQYPENEGFKTTGEPNAGKGPVGIIVVGINRGGTSAVAACLDAIGVFLGESSSEPNYEDACLAAGVRKRDWKKLKQIIASYEAAHETFAWKYPGIRNHLLRINRLLTNPRYIFVYRDIFSIANRQGQFSQASPVRLMAGCLWDYARILLFAHFKSPYALHVSYEKLLTKSGKFAEALLSFCGLAHDSKLIERIVERISASDQSYFEWSLRGQQMLFLERLGYKGLVEDLSGTSVTGWAFRIRDQEPSAVEVYVNGRLLGNAVADRYHDRFATISGVTRNGCVGFQFTFGDPVLSADDTVSVKFRGTQHELVSSPRRVRPV